MPSNPPQNENTPQELIQSEEAVAFGLDSIKIKAKALKVLVTQVYNKWQLQVRRLPQSRDHRATTQHTHTHTQAREHRATSQTLNQTRDDLRRTKEDLITSRMVRF